MLIQSWNRSIVAAGLVAAAAVLLVPAAAADVDAEAEHPTSTTVVVPKLGEVEVRAQVAQVAQATAAPTLQVTPRTGLAAGGQTVTVTGTGFDAARNGGVGVYVVFGPKEADFATNAETFKSAKWIHPGAAASAGQGPMAPDGSFITSIDVVASYTTTGGRAIDCRVTTCSVLAMAAHGIPDRTQDAQVALAFAAGGTGTTTTTARPSTGGAPSTSTSTPASVPVAVAGATATPSSSTGGATAAGSSESSSTGSDALAQTGSAVAPLLVLGLLVATLGATLVAISHTRSPVRSR